MSNGEKLRSVAHSPTIFNLLICQDRRPLGHVDLVEPPPPTELTQASIKRKSSSSSSGIQMGSSAKIDQLVYLLKLTPPLEKSLVFSQFTSFLDKVEYNKALHAGHVDIIAIDRRSIGQGRVCGHFFHFLSC